MERRVAAIAGRQHGTVTRRQLLAAGASASQIDRMLTRSYLISVHRGVYRVGHEAPSQLATYMAAVLACGEGAALSGRAAGHLHSVLRNAPSRPEVTTLAKRTVPGVAMKRGSAPTTTVQGIPVTTVARTLVDLAATLTEDELARACHEAGVKHRTTPRHVEAVMRPNAPGAAALRRILRGDTRVTLSQLEKQFLRLLRENHLPLPQTNRARGGRRVDCHWPGLTIELDSYTFHNSRHAWERDRRREREARARGDEFRRYTWGDVFEEPDATLRELRPLLQPRPER